MEIEIDNYQKSLLTKLHDDLINIKFECFQDESFEDVVNMNIFESDIDKIIDKIKNVT